MVFITSNIELHFIDNLWTFKTQNTEYGYIDVEMYIYTKVNKAVEIYKN